MPASSFIFVPGNKLFDERQISSAMNNPITPNSIKLKYLKKRLFFFFLPNKEYIYFVSWAMFITHKLFYAILKKEKKKKRKL